MGCGQVRRQRLIAGRFAGTGDPGTAGGRREAGSPLSSDSMPCTWSCQMLLWEGVRVGCGLLYCLVSSN